MILIFNQLLFYVIDKVPRFFSFLASKRRDDPSSLFSKFRLNNDVMSGFKRYLITEDCGDPQCSYSLRVSSYDLKTNPRNVFVCSSKNQKLNRSNVGMNKD